LDGALVGGLISGSAARVGGMGSAGESGIAGRCDVDANACGWDVNGGGAAKLGYADGGAGMGMP